MAIAQSKGEKPAISEKLVARMQKIVNGELLAIASIPLAASLMAGRKSTRALGHEVAGAGRTV